MKTNISQLKPGSLINGILLSGIVLCALLLRLIGLTKFDFWFDEISCLSKVTLDQLIRESLKSYCFQPLYSLFLYYWRNLGSSEFFLRLPSVIAGVVSVFLMYKLIRKLFDSKTGLIGALLLGISPFAVYFSQELLPLSWVILFSLASTYFYVRAITESSSRYWFGNIACNIINVYLRYSSIMVLFSQCLFFIIYRRRFKNSKHKFFLAQLIQAILLLPWLYIVGTQLSQIFFYTQGTGQIMSFVGRVSILNLFYTFKNFSAGYYASDIVRTISFVLMAVLFVKGAVILFSSQREKIILIFLLCFIPIFSLLIFSQFVSFYSEKYFVYVVAFFYIPIAVYLKRLSLKPRVAIIVVISILSLISLDDYYANRICSNYLERQGIHPHKEYRKVAQYLKDNYIEGDLLIHVSENSVLSVEYYLNPGTKKYFIDAGVENTSEFMRQGGITQKCGYQRLIIHDIAAHRFYLYKDIYRAFLPQDNDSLFDRYKRIWLVSSCFEINCPAGRLASGWLAKNYRLQESRDFNGIGLLLFRNDTLR
jgi:uncharacterized membrane protein